MSAPTFNEQARASIELIDRRSAAIEKPAAINPMQELQMRLIREADLDKISKLMDLEERWRKQEALKAFNEAMAQFKAMPHTIRKNKHVAFDSKSGGARTDYWHATLDNVCASIVPALANVGLRHAWNVVEAQGSITVTCTITHHMGHSESVSLSGPLDSTGNKNVIQQKGSTVTYLERYTLLALTGLAATDQDNDGRSAQQAPESFMDEGSAADFLSLIEGSADQPELQANYFKARDAAEAAGDKQAAQTFSDAKNKRFRQIAKGVSRGN